MISTTYNIEFIKPNKQKIKVDNMNMNNTIKKIKELIKEHYFLDVNITRNVIYGLAKRPQLVSKLIKSLVNVKIIKTEKEGFKIKYIYNTKSKREYLKSIEGSTENVAVN